MRRLLLFDVDGTLVSGGPGKRAFLHAFKAVLGRAMPLEDLDFSGKTDLQIVRELTHRDGLSPQQVDEALPRLWSRYLAELENLIGDDPPRRLPGVARLLDEVERRGEAALGLVTGNLADGARLKLGAVGLADRFPVGAYGGDHEERDLLPSLAAERAARHWGRTFEPRTVVVIGDTPRDIRCARAHGARSVAVATGRFSAAELEREGPDHVLEDFRDTSNALLALGEGNMDRSSGDGG